MSSPLEILYALGPIEGLPVAVHMVEHLPVAATLISAMRDDDGTVTDFCVVYSNLAASATSPDRTETYGKALFDVIPAFREVGLFERYVEALETRTPYTQEGVRLTGTFGDIEYDVRLDVVAIPISDDLVLSVSHDRTEQHETSVRLTRVQETLSRREQLEQQIHTVNAGLVDDLVSVQRALDGGDVHEARRHAMHGVGLAAEVVTGLRDVIRTGA